MPLTRSALTIFTLVCAFTAIGHTAYHWLLATVLGGNSVRLVSSVPNGIYLHQIHTTISFAVLGLALGVAVTFVQRKSLSAATTHRLIAALALSALAACAGWTLFLRWKIADIAQLTSQAAEAGLPFALDLRHVPLHQIGFFAAATTMVVVTILLSLLRARSPAA